MQKKKILKTYLLYHLKWQLGFVVTLPLMYLFLTLWNFSYPLALFLFQLIGACIFWYVDKWIFKQKYNNQSLNDIHQNIR